ncbi:MAG: glycosyltransferase family 9 protein [Saprospiraceae bacterium]|nr:glycosyltransferase family 9 protein [Saprospiraceae bacterium]
MTKILVIRFSSIGDIVLTTPILRCLSVQTGAEIHFLTKSAYSSLLRPNPYISRIWALEDSMSSLLPALHREGFDYIVDLHKNLRTWRTRFFLGVPGSSFPKLNLAKWLMVNLKVNRLPDRHIVDRYFDAVKSLGVRYDGAGLDHFFPDDDTPKLPGIRGGRIPKDLVCFAIGGAHSTKRLPMEQLKKICLELPNPIVLIGGASEASAGKQLAALDPDRIYDLCGQVGLHESAKWIRESSVLITHDTGMMHLGAALRKRIVSIWGNTIPAFGMYPFYPEGASPAFISEVLELSCRPCSKIGFDVCPKGHFNCMQGQNILQILDQVKKETELR